MGRSSVVIAAAAIALLFHFTGEANARGGGSGPSCQQGSVGGNVGTITGTATVEAINYNSGFADSVDATLRLTWKGKEGVYRTSLSTGSPGGIEIVSPADLLCKVLANDPLNNDTVQFLSQTVGVANATSLYITDKSITGSNFNPVPGTGNYSGIAEVKIYVPSK